MSEHPRPPPAVIEQFGLDPDSIAPISGGLINASFGARRTAGGDVVVQRVNPIFSPAVQADIDAVTRHLRARGLTTPVLVPTGTGRLFLDVEGAIWRALTRIRGETYESLTTREQAGEAGRVLGAFHAALGDFEAPLANRRPPVHEIARHLRALQSALAANSTHPARPSVERIAKDIDALLGALGPMPELPERLVHGDPKISNVVFADGRAVCLVDLDTLARMPVPLELGDALRSWCNPAGEDSPEARFSIELFRSALEGYRRGSAGLLSPEEWQAVPRATISIAAELAARFAADALNEVYFAWDRARYASASAHNLVRSEAQLRLAQSLVRALPGMHEVVVTLA